jgi:hypothetical protein
VRSLLPLLAGLLKQRNSRRDGLGLPARQYNDTISSLERQRLPAPEVGEAEVGTILSAREATAPWSGSAPRPGYDEGSSRRATCPRGRYPCDSRSKAVSGSGLPAPAEVGRSSQVRPWRRRPLFLLFTPPHCLKKKGTPAATHSSWILWTHAARIGLAPGPDSPPTITQLTPVRSRQRIGPRSGSKETNFTCAGVFRRSSTRDM